MDKVTLLKAMNCCLIDYDDVEEYDFCQDCPMLCEQCDNPKTKFVTLPLFLVEEALKQLGGSFPVQ